MQTMTSRERILRMFQHQEADRIPIVDKPWGDDTIRRWQSEGMPAGMDYQDYFEIDKVIRVDIDNSPKFQQKILEETPEYIISTTSWGETRKSWRTMTSTPQSLDFVIKTPDDWQQAKKLMTPSKERIPWDYLKNNYAEWRHEEALIMFNINFGFDITHSYMLGMEPMLIALIEDPDWCKDMFTHQLNVALALLDIVWESGYTFDLLRWPDDMGYKGHQFFSLETYRDILKPLQQRAIDWAHSKGIPAYLHSCGNITPFISELAEIGLDGLNPLEVKAGMDPLAIKTEFGDRLLFHGGINTLLWENLDKMENVIRQNVPILMKNGGYLFGTDHSVPSSVGVKDFKRIIEVVKEIGQY